MESTTDPSGRVSRVKRRLKRSRIVRAALNLRKSSRASLARLLQRGPWSSRFLGPPKGYYWGADEYHRASNPEATGPAYRVLIPSQEVTIPAPRAIFGRGDEIFDKPLAFRTEDAFLLTLPSARYYARPHSIITADDRLLAEVSSWYGDQPADHWIFNKWKLEAPRRLKGRTLFLSSGSSYFHFLFDSLPVLHLLDLERFSLADFDHIIMEPPRQPFEETLVNQLGIPRHNFVNPKEHAHLLCEQLTVPPIGWRHGKWRVDFLERTFASHGIAPGPDSKRVYVSRRGARTRRVKNEHELDDVLRRHHFVTVATEELSFYEQVGLFQHAEIVIATEGAALTNLCFCRPGTRVLMLMCDNGRYGHAAMRLWDLIAHYRELEFFLLFAESSEQEAPQGHVYDLHVDVRCFETAVDELLA